MIKTPLILFIGLWLLLTSLRLPAYAKTLSNIVINEVAWMGTEEQWQNEWLELYNPTNLLVSLDGWTLKAKDESPKIVLLGTIGANSYFLLERTDDSTVPDINAEQIYKGGLNNSGEHLMLFNGAGEIVDEVDCILGWFAGSNETKKTMERLSSSTSGSDPSNWKTSQKTGGTPGAENSPEEKTKKEESFKTISVASSGSNFSFILAVAIAISLFVSLLTFAFWLKIRQKKDRIKLL